MRLSSIFALVIVLLVSKPALTDDFGDRHAAELERKVAELESRLEAIVEELRAVRRQLAPPALTPQQAFDSFRRDPEKPVTVEFGVVPGSGTLFSEVDYENEPIHLTWDWVLDDKTRFTATLMPEAWRALRIPGKHKGAPPIKPPPGEERARVARHIETNGLRVTGVLQQGGRSMIVADPSKVVLYLAGQPGSEIYSETAPRDAR
jgi:hypothetical protein